MGRFKKGDIITPHGYTKSSNTIKLTGLIQLEVLYDSNKMNEWSKESVVVKILVGNAGRTGAYPSITSRNGVQIRSYGNYRIGNNIVLFADSCKIYNEIQSETQSETSIPTSQKSDVLKNINKNTLMCLLIK